MARKLNKIGLTVIAFVGVACMLFLTGMVWIYTVRRTTIGEVQIERDSLGGNLLCFLLTALFAYGIYEISGFLGRKILHIIAILFAIGLTGLIFFMIEAASATQPVADQAQILFGTEWLMDGKYEEIYNYSYFRVYPYQLQVSKFFGGIIRIFGKSVWESLKLLQRVNAVCVGITFYAGICIVWKLFEDVRAEGLYLILAVPFVPMYVYALFIYGEAMGVCSSVLAIYFYSLVKQEKYQEKWRIILYWAGMALCLWVAYLLRSALMIVWIAIFILEFLSCLKKKNWYQLLYVIVVLGVVLGGQKLFYLSIGAKTGLSVDKGAPITILCIAMGMQGGEEVSDNPGSYNGYNWDTFTGCEYDVRASVEQARIDIQRRLDEWNKQPTRMFRFYKSKILNQWAEPSYSVFSSTRMMSEPAEWVVDFWYNEKHHLLYNILNRYQSIAYLLILVYFFHLFLVREEREYLPGLILVGGFLFSIIWESQSRYTYPYIVIALPCIAVGMKYCMDGINILTKKMRKKR